MDAGGGCPGIESDVFESSTRNICYKVRHDVTVDLENISRDNDRRDQGNVFGTKDLSETRRTLRVRRFRSIVPEKARQKRQAMQDMVRPLKHWLCQHRHNPYPNRQQKASLASDSRMTLTQVSNWFANARRRLKNTVRGPGLPWAVRIARYNSHLVGNAERFSLCSEDSLWDSGDEACGDDGEKASHSSYPESHSTHCAGLLHEHPISSFADGSRTHGSHRVEMPHVEFPKYKHSILQRYLADAYRHSGQIPQGALPSPSGRGRHVSGSLGSHDSEEMSTSSVSSPHNDNHNGSVDDISEETEYASRRRRNGDICSPDGEDMYWKEISAAVALANLATSCQ